MASDKNQTLKIKKLISKGHEQGYLSYAEVNDHLPQDITDSEQLEDIVGMLHDMGITVCEVPRATATCCLTRMRSLMKKTLKK